MKLLLRISQLIYVYYVLPNCLFNLNITPTAFGKLFIIAPGFADIKRLNICHLRILVAGMLTLFVLLSLSTSSDTIHLTEVADIAMAVQQYFHTRCTVLHTRDTCKYKAVDTCL